ncbi:MAG: thioredoxin [Chloroflexi bacterium]|nr:thioredoxin [Chloroflexota bacterium]
MANIPEINEEDFQSQVLDAAGPILVDFGATWCNPCKMLDPIVDELAADWAANVKFVKVDVDSNPMVAMNYQVMGVPTLLLFKGGQVQERLVGYKPKDQIVAKLSPHLELA